MLATTTLNPNSYKSPSFTRRLHHLYLNERDWKPRLRAFSALAKVVGLEAKYITTSIALELATQAHTDRLRTSLTDIAIESANKAREIALKAPPYAPHRLNALRLSANLPALITLRIHDDYPSIGQIRKAFERHRQDLNESSEALVKIRSGEFGSAQGEQAESYVLLSLQKYAIEKIGNGFWLPLPAIGHEEATNSAVLAKNPSWDIGVYELSQGENDLICKLQVKRQATSKKDNYTDDVTLLYVKNDLALTDEKNHGLPEVSIRRLITETNPNASSYQQDRWEQRIEKIIDKIG
jgi:hypothetical protein